MIVCEDHKTVRPSLVVDAVTKPLLQDTPNAICAQWQKAAAAQPQAQRSIYAINSAPGRTGAALLTRDFGVSRKPCIDFLRCLFNGLGVTRTHLALKAVSRAGQIYASPDVINVHGHSGPFGAMRLAGKFDSKRSCQLKKCLIAKV